MKKKNVIGHMVASKNASKGWFQRLNILPRALCLLIAIVIWLLVVNVVPSQRSKTVERTPLSVESVEK